MCLIGKYFRPHKNKQTVLAQKIQKYLSIQGLYKDRHSYGRSTMSTQLVGVFNFPILKFEEGKSAPGVAFCSKGSVFRNGGVHPSGKPSNCFIFEIIVDC